MKQIKKLLEIVYKKNTLEDWDTVWIIAGDEGVGKSNIGKHIVEWWYKKMYGKVVEEDVKHLCLNRDMFIKDIIKLKPKECTNYDECGDLSNRRVMSDFNFKITQAYQVIRGENLFTVLTLPSIFDLDPYFSKRRVRGLIYVYKRGRFAFWSKQRIRKMLALNQHFYVKNYWIVKPTYSCGYSPKYTGILEAPYLKLKQEKMGETRKKLTEGTEKKKDEKKELLLELADQFGTETAASLKSSPSRRTIQRWLRQRQDDITI